MCLQWIVYIVSCYVEGEVGDVIVGGVVVLFGVIFWEQLCWIVRDQDLCNFVFNELCGGVFCYVNLLVLVKDLCVQMGWIIMELVDILLMFGFNLLCVVIVLFDSGILLMCELLIWLLLEVLGGLIEVCVECCDGKVEWVEICNVLLFVDCFDVWIEVEGFGLLQVDIVYGGDSFVIVDVWCLGFVLCVDEVVELVVIGLKIIYVVNE